MTAEQMLRNIVPGYILAELEAATTELGWWQAYHKHHRNPDGFPPPVGGRWGIGVDDAVHALHWWADVGRNPALSHSDERLVRMLEQKAIDAWMWHRQNSPEIRAIAKGQPARSWAAIAEARTLLELAPHNPA